MVLCIIVSQRLAPSPYLPCFASTIVLVVSGRSMRSDAIREPQRVSNSLLPRTAVNDTIVIFSYRVRLPDLTWFF